MYVPADVQRLLPPGLKASRVSPGFDMVMQQDMTMGDTGVGSSFLRFFQVVAGKCDGKGTPFQRLLCESLERDNLENFPSAVPVDGTVAFRYDFVGDGELTSDRPGVPMSSETADTRVFWKRCTFNAAVQINKSPPKIDFMVRGRCGAKKKVLRVGF